MFSERWTIGVYTILYNTCILLQKYLNSSIETTEQPKKMYTHFDMKNITL